MNIARYRTLILQKCYELLRSNPVGLTSRKLAELSDYDLHNGKKMLSYLLKDCGEFRIAHHSVGKTGLNYWVLK